MIRRNLTDFNSEGYFDWLYHETFPNENYYELAQAMHRVEFTYSIRMDSNRAADGVSMRNAYLYEHGVPGETPDDDPCSFLEMFAGLTKKMAMLLDKSMHETSMHLLRNIDLASYTDQHFRVMEVLEVLDMIMDREYQYSGLGGFFPLNDPPTDQRDVELLYQLNQYIIEYGW